ncbi:MAG: Rnase Y domain-containing protein, partial [Nitrospinota bacterium]|nr:Rnase Y domain-containing protein [Nitrospinota bacterium]
MLTDTNLLIALCVLMVLSIAIILFLIASSKKNLSKTQNEFDAKIKSLERDAEEKLSQKIKDLEISHKGQLFQLREKLVNENKDRFNELQKIEDRLTQREDVLDKRRQNLDSKDFSIEKRLSQMQEREKKIEENEEHYSQLIEEENKKLERISGLTAQDAKKELMDKYEEEAKKDIHKEIKKYEEKVKQNLTIESQKLIATAAERYSNDYVAESLVSVVVIPNEEMKGRIIGREGRNIRALELATGVDIIVDDTPEAVIVSAFDKVRREIARLSLEFLVEDGRIHPGRIEEVVKKTTTEIENLILQAGKDAVVELSIEDVHPDLIKHLGRMKYRTSYNQNALEHSKEVAHLAGILANELGLNPYMAKRAGLFHDI